MFHRAQWSSWKSNTWIDVLMAGETMHNKVTTYLDYKMAGAHREIVQSELCLFDRHVSNPTSCC